MSYFLKCWFLETCSINETKSGIDCEWFMEQVKISAVYMIRKTANSRHLIRLAKNLTYIEIL